MADRLIVDEARNGYHLQWIVDGDEGAVVGDDAADGCGEEPTNREAWECWIAARLAKEAGGVRCGDDGFCWDDRSSAAAALRVIKAAWKSRGRPLPDWAKQAIAAGWPPPKGWKP